MILLQLWKMEIILTWSGRQKSLTGSPISTGNDCFFTVKKDGTLIQFMSGSDRFLFLVILQKRI